tara:strand:- start:9830 stop:11152 length:1323 start_codon:yes stop_codon:yes gene_type:complete
MLSNIQATFRRRSRTAGQVAGRSLRSSTRAVLALSDQAVVSAMSFAMTVVIGRVCGKAELGLYALGMSVVLLAIAAQQSLISAAHTVFSVRLVETEKQNYNGVVAIQFVALGLAIAVLLAIATAVFVVGTGDRETGRVLMVLVIAAPCILIREFVRRFEFARFRVTSALSLDVVIASVQISLLALLAYTGFLSGTSGLLAVGVSCALTGAIWFYRNRTQFKFDEIDHATQWKRGWQFGRWVFAGQITFAMVGFCIQWIMVMMIDKSAVGVYGACMTLVLLANPVILGLQNLLSPSIAKAVHHGGRVGARNLVAKATVALTFLMAAYVAVVVLFGDIAMIKLYGDAFAGNGRTISILGIGALATAIGVSSNHGLRALERPELNFAASLVGLTSGVVAAIVLIPSLGVAGAASGYAVSCIVTSLARLLSFAVVSRSTLEVAA